MDDFVSRYVVLALSFGGFVALIMYCIIITIYRFYKSFEDDDVYIEV